ncbi:hypothetical protein AVEN_236035-1 [Araneus ventricosus]|uniref:Uncharacterized protein n=1 Tax=Araneus ventricosus TaxID=182803 RepID=A0A4Y2LBN2_ARAVE|nr:hypothetical protein AVEN_236035-1 [Araneus ventricosus]
MVARLHRQAYSEADGCLKTLFDDLPFPEMEKIVWARALSQGHHHHIFMRFRSFSLPRHRKWKRVPGQRTYHLSYTKLLKNKARRYKFIQIFLSTSKRLKADKKSHSGSFMRWKCE